MEKVFLSGLALLTIGCSQKNTEIQKSDMPISAEVVEKVYVLPIIPDSIKNDTLNYTIFLTNLYEDGASDLIASNFSVHEITKNRISIISESEFTHHPLGLDTSVEGLQARNNNIFEVAEEEKEESYYHKLSYGNSYIKTTHLNFKGWECDEYMEIDEDYIICAEIVDSEIRFRKNINLGMTKQDLVYNRLGLKISPSIDTLDLGCTSGDIRHQYIFRNDRLVKVRLGSNSNLDDFELY